MKDRVISIDVLRGLTILLMVFVNDLGKAAPAWMHHIKPSSADGMTLADVVFPLFLFIAGVSIPLAFRAARSRGESTLRIFVHIVVRSAALIVMGLVEVNRAADKSLGADLWGLLAFTFILFAWCTVPKVKNLESQTRDTKRSIFIAIRAIGVIGLIAVLVLFRSEPVATKVLFMGDVEGWSWLRTQWWGILGLIGWSYLACALIFLVVGPRREWLVGAACLLMLNFIVAQHGGFFSHIETKQWVGPIEPLISGIKSVIEFVNRYVSLQSQLGSLPATMMCGCVLGTVLSKDSEIQSAKERVQWAMMFAAGLFVAGLMTDTFAGINKISATPTWCLWSAAIATVIWVGLFLVVDVRQWQAWSVPFRWAGQSPLVAYLLHPILIFILTLTGMGGTVRSYWGSENWLIVVAGSLAMAVVVCLLTGLLSKIGLRVRL